jgi:hypothetical protein
VVWEGDRGDPVPYPIIPAFWFTRIVYGTCEFGVMNPKRERQTGGTGTSWERACADAGICTQHWLVPVARPGEQTDNGVE